MQRFNIKTVSQIGLLTSLTAVITHGVMAQQPAKPQSSVSRSPQGIDEDVERRRSSALINRLLPKEQQLGVRENRTYDGSNNKQFIAV